MKRVLISGGTGFIGSALARRLQNQCEVVVTTRDSARAAARYGPDAPEFIEVGVPLSDKDAEQLTAAAESVDVVFNLSGSPGAVHSNSDPLLSLAVGCADQLRFLHACTATGRRPHVVFASTRLVYGRVHQNPVAESHPLSPQSFYAAHKLCVENYHSVFALQGALTYTNCRIANPFGIDLGVNPSVEYSFLNQMIRKGVDLIPIRLFGDGGQLRDYIYIEDLVDALILCGVNQDARNRTFNIGSGIGVSIADTARHIAELTGTAIEFIPWPDGYKSVETGDFVTCIEALKTLGFSPRFALGEGLAACVEMTRRTPHA